MPACSLFSGAAVNSSLALQQGTIGTPSARWGSWMGPMEIHCNFHGCATCLRSETAALVVEEGRCETDYRSAGIAAKDDYACAGSFSTFEDLLLLDSCCLPADVLA